MDCLITNLINSSNYLLYSIIINIIALIKLSFQLLEGFFLSNFNNFDTNKLLRISSSSSKFSNSFF